MTDPDTRPIAVVIPTTEASDEAVRTLDSIPDDVPTSVEREGSLNEARNQGVRRADADRIIIMDDDLAFDAATFEHVVSRIDRGRLLGIADWDFGWTAGRVMAFYRNLWDAVGGFDERLGSHMGDTEFALACRREGAELVRIPRHWFDHDPHERSITTWDRVWRAGYIAAKHPTAAPRIGLGMAGISLGESAGTTAIEPAQSPVATDGGDR